MVVDRKELTRRLGGFYDFKGKSILYVGAGGGQLLDPSWRPTKVTAIDSNGKALDNFRNEAMTKWSGIEVDFIPRPFETVRGKADVVYFEFCLHQMDGPMKSLELARSLAEDIVVMDHLPGSEWIFYGAEEDLVERSTKAVEAFGIRKQERLSIEQKFADYEQLAKRMAEVGEESRTRVLRFEGARAISIRMDYGLFLL